MLILHTIDPITRHQRPSSVQVSDNSSEQTVSKTSHKKIWYRAIPAARRGSYRHIPNHTEADKAPQ